MSFGEFVNCFSNPNEEDVYNILSLVIDTPSICNTIQPPDLVLDNSWSAFLIKVKYLIVSLVRILT